MSQRAVLGGQAAQSRCSEGYHYNLIDCLARLIISNRKMAQIKIYGLSLTLNRVRAELSDSIHNSIMAAFQYPAEKRFHRFIALEKDDFISPPDRSSNYIILEISIFEGRTVEA